MLFQPSYQLHIIQENQFEAAITEIETTLQKYATRGSLTTFDGCNLEYEYYLAENSRASVVIVHGFTEFYEKYYEMTWYLLNMGYNVFLYDHRGHGLSGQTNKQSEEEPRLVHVDHFQDYVQDLTQVIDKVVLPASANLPIYLFAHSMGGAVGTFYLASDECKVSKAVLSSPMVCPVTEGIPAPIVRIASRHYGKKYGWTTRFPHSHNFDPNVDHCKTSDVSYARFKHNLEYRIRDTRYQTSASTNCWMHQALSIQKPLLSPAVTNNIHAKVLLLSAENDTVVKNHLQKKLASKLSDCSFQVVPNSKHTTYTGSYEVLELLYHSMLDFYQDTTN